MIVDQIARAISRQEGPNNRNNPGNLRWAGQIGASSSGLGGEPPLAKFSSLGLGVVGLYRQIWADIARGDTLRQLIWSWAPPSENNSDQYALNVANWTGLPLDVPLVDLVEQEWTGS